MSKHRQSSFANVDWITIGIYGILVLFGWMNVYSASYNPANTFPFSFSEFYGKQALWVGVSLLLAVLILYMEGDFFLKFAIPIYGFCVLLLLLVLAVGKEVNGAKAWFGFGSFGIQPSEFAKTGTSLLLASYVSSVGAKFKTWKTRISAIAIIGLPAGLVALQPDVGSLLVSAAFVLAMYREGLSGNILIIALVAIVLSVVSIIAGAGNAHYPFFGEQSGVWWVVFTVFLIGLIAFLFVKTFIPPRNRKVLYWVVIVSTVLSCGYSLSVNVLVEKVFKDYHKDRIYVALDLFPDTPTDTQGNEISKKEMTPEERERWEQIEKATYNIKMAKYTIGNGGWFGNGFLHGSMTQSHFVPEQETDFIFSAVAEEWGFTGSALLLGLFVFLIVRLINLAERQRSAFSRIYGYCVASIFFLHVLINVGMVIGLAPVIGIPLPFFSYGGSSLMAFTVLLFIMVRLDAERLSIFR